MCGPHLSFMHEWTFGNRCISWADCPKTSQLIRAACNPGKSPLLYNHRSPAKPLIAWPINTPNKNTCTYIDSTRKWECRCSCCHVTHHVTMQRSATAESRDTINRSVFNTWWISFTLFSYWIQARRGGTRRCWRKHWDGSDSTTLTVRSFYL